jgi:hypothetical protein
VGGFLLFAVIPGLGIVADGYILAHSFLAELTKEEWTVGKGVVVYVVALAVLAALLAAVARVRPVPPDHPKPVTPESALQSGSGSVNRFLRQDGGVG